MNVFPKNITINQVSKRAHKTLHGSRKMELINPFTKLQSWGCSYIAKKPEAGRLLVDLSPVFAYVRSNPESAYGIVPVYQKWLMISPRWYVRAIMKSNRPRWQKFSLLAFGFTLGPLWTLFIHQMANVRDVHWRGKAVADAIAKDLVLQADSSEMGRLQIDVIGAGSGAYAIDAFMQFQNQRPERDLTFTLVDQDSCTYGLARHTAYTRGMNDREFSINFPMITADVLQDEFYSKHEAHTRNMVVMIGIGDHIDKVIRDRHMRQLKDSDRTEDVAATNRDLISLIQKIRRTLKPGGSLVFSFVSHNSEEDFLEKVVKWRHRYRSRKMIEEVMIMSGWDMSKVQFTDGPTGIQHLMVAKK